MFLVAMTTKPPSDVPASLGILQREAVKVAEGLWCGVYATAAGYDVTASAEEIVVRGRDVPDGELFRLAVREQRAVIHKPLMLGLPVYYSATDTAFVVSTHVRLLREYGVEIREDPSILAEYLLYRFVSAPRSLFLGVSCVPIGGSVRVAVDRDRLRPEAPEWTHVFAGTSERLGLDASAARIHADLESSVRSLEPRRERVACLMSGGIDSSILFKLCQDALSLQESHSTGYPFEAEEHNDERTYNRCKPIINPVLSPVLGLLALKTRLRGGVRDNQFNWPRLYAFSRRRWDLDFRNPKHALWLLGQYADKRWLKQQFGVEEEVALRGRMEAISHFEIEEVLDAFSILGFVVEAVAMQDLWGKLACAAGRRLVLPFNSPGLLTAARQTSWQEKLAEHKRLARRVGQLAGVPDFILSRPKRHFGIRANRWARPGGVLASLLGLASPVFEPKLLRELLGDDEHRVHTCLSLVCYAIWKRIVIDREPVESLCEELRASDS